MEIYSLENKIFFTKFALYYKTNLMKRDKIIYYLATGLLTVLLLFSVSKYVFL